LGRDAYGFDWERVMKVAKKHGVVFELNANPHRLDLDWRRGAEICEYGIPLCVNPDAHSVEGLSDVRWGEAMAEKAMVPAGLVLNLMGVDEMESWLRRRRR
jgi:DNA polymerase (family 10)